MEPAPATLHLPSVAPDAESHVDQGQTHQILWSLAEEYIDQARSLCFVANTQPNSQPVLRQQHQDLIITAVKCLVACLALDSPSMTQLDRAKTGLRLAQILFEETDSLDRSEDEVDRAIQSPAARDVQLRLYDLQIQISIEQKRYRQAKTRLGIAAIEASRHDLHWWRYHFCLVEARVHFLMHDIAKSLKVLNQGAAIAEKRGDFDLKMTFWIIAGQYALILANWDKAMSYLNQLTPHMGLNDELQVQQPKKEPSKGAVSETPSKSRSDMASTSTSIQPPRKEQEQDQQQPSTRPLQPQLCQSKQLRVFFLILYVSCMLRSGTMTKALAALAALHVALDETQSRDPEELQGIFRIPLNDPLSSDGNRRQSTTWTHIPIKWMTFSQVYCLTYLLSGICNKADMTQPTKAQQFLVEGLKVVDRELNVNDCGRLEEALEWYGICLNHEQEYHRDPEGYEAKTLAILNTAIIYCGELHQDLQKAKQLQMEARTRSTSNMSASNVYLQTHDEQAEKMLTAGYRHAVKTNNKIVAAAAGSCLKDLYLATSQGIKASQQAEQNVPIFEAVDQAFQSRVMGPLLHDGAGAEQEK
ncbi:hypothetical protein BGZ99_007592 [Dissophora globulifera]|uniref:Uncharacterized protein n=1 Tax=Dissophora globulifera TaxID=979702 RepID=A0A9P6R934_9FUNG|nr:hypothetical protein BGZ99_007592 [Dissophora globulifera]